MLKHTRKKMSETILSGINITGLHPALLRANQPCSLIINRNISSNYSNIDDISDDVPTDKTEDSCSVCRTNKSIIALFPCGHKCVCKICTIKLIEKSAAAPTTGTFNCPLCRNQVKSFERIF